MMKRIIERINFENKIREKMNKKYIKTSREELDILEIMEVFEEVEE